MKSDLFYNRYFRDLFCRGDTITVCTMAKKKGCDLNMSPKKRFFCMFIFHLNIICDTESSPTESTHLGLTASLCSLTHTKWWQQWKSYLLTLRLAAVPFTSLNFFVYNLQIFASPFQWFFENDTENLLKQLKVPQWVYEVTKLKHKESLFLLIES